MIHRNLRDLPVHVLEREFETVRRELEAVPEEAFETWPQQESFLGSWKSFAIYYHDRPSGFRRSTAENRLLVPHIVTLLEGVPGVERAVAKLMGPRTHVPPHAGIIIGEPFRVHLGIRVPQNCGLRVGADTLQLPVGELIGFDPAIEHEAANMSFTDDRLILIVDLALNPEQARKYRAPVEQRAAPPLSLQFEGPKGPWAEA